jgi:sugar phosphate isomerase/epimerase
MKNTIPRRTFLRTAGAAAAAGSGLFGTDEGSVPAAHPRGGAPRTSREPRLFAGCCAYSYHKHLERGPMTMEDFILKGVELGVHGVDVTVYYLKSTDPAYLTGLRHLAFKNGMPFSGAACGSSTVQADQGRRSQVLADIKKWVDVTDWLGASHLRIFAGELPPGATVEQGVDWTVEVMKPASDYAGKKGITLGVEDHGGITQKAETTLEILRRVDSPYAGVNLDISNFLAASDAEQYTQIEACIPYATHTHIRDRFGDSHRPIDLERVWKLFAQAGYKGYMSAEYEGEEDPVTGVPKLIDRIKALCRKYSSA